MKSPTSLYIFKRPDGFYKIGISNNPHKRLEECKKASISNKRLGLELLEFWNFPALTLGLPKDRIARSVESRLHNLFVRKRHEYEREYFELTDEDLRLAFSKLDILGMRSHDRNPFAILIPKVSNRQTNQIIETVNWLNIKEEAYG